MKDWNDFKVLLTLYRERSLMAAAEKLDIHHATVLRKVRAIEEEMGVILFHRHSRGHSATEAMNSLVPFLERMEKTTFELRQTVENSKEDLSGDLVITTPPGLSPTLRPIINSFIREYPGVNIKLLLLNERVDLESNSAHIAIRPGQKPSELDYIANKVGSISYGLFATKEYLKGKREVEYKYIRISRDLSHIPINNWLCENIEDEKVLITTNLFSDIASSVISGLAIGPMVLEEAIQHKNLIQVGESKRSWDNNLFVVYHKNLKTNKKVKVFNKYLKDNFDYLLGGGKPL